MDILTDILIFILRIGIGALAACATFAIFKIIQFIIECIREEERSPMTAYAEGWALGHGRRIASEDDGDEYVCLFDENVRIVRDRPAPSNASAPPDANPDIRDFNIDDEIAIECIREEEDDGDENVRIVRDRPAPSNASTPQANPEIRGFNIDDEIDQLTGKQGDYNVSSITD